ncbi:MAG: hypothetical protein NTY11_02725 [Candidatus Parcubacteria bacterium]|nr:hypothetical protein [Candidatus Parcubacteria bacterium]
MEKAVSKNNVPGIKIVFVNVLVISIILISFIQILLAEDITAKIINILILVAYAFISALLIAYSLSEERQRRVLEKMIEERTEAIIDSKQILMERVDEIAKSKVALQKRTKELEAWHKLVKGRELKMAELKQTLESLQAKEK